MWITEIAEDVTELATRITELATRITVALPERLHAIRAEMAGQPRAARYDTGGVSHQWCWTHERDVDRCQRDDLDCTGETFDIHDPAGEAATAAAMGADPASRDRRDLERQLRAAQRALNISTDILARYSPARPDIPRAGIGTCSDCPRYCDGTNGNRLTVYKGTVPVCPACRARRDRASQQPAQCQHLRVRFFVGEDGAGRNECVECGARVAA